MNNCIVKFILRWLFIDDIHDIAYSERGMELLYDIVKKSRTQSCTVTLSAQFLQTLTDDVGNNNFLALITFLTLLTLDERDKAIIRKYYGKYLSKSDMQFIDKYDEHSGENYNRNGLHIINGRLIDDDSSDNLLTIPFNIKL